jgi:hypothetical protein
MTFLHKREKIYISYNYLLCLNMAVSLDTVVDFSFFFRHTVSVIRYKGWNISTQLGLLGRACLRHCLSGVETFPFLNSMTGTDPVSETSCVRKLKTVGCVWNNSHVFCYTPSTEKLRLRYLCLMELRNWQIFLNDNLKTLLIIYKITKCWKLQNMQFHLVRELYLFYIIYKKSFFWQCVCSWIDLNYYSFIYKRMLLRILWNSMWCYCLFLGI